MGRWSLVVMLAVGCVPDLPVVPDSGPPVVVDSGVPDAGPQELAWRKVTEVAPTRSNQVAFYWPPAQATLVFSGNHNTGPIHDAWSWDGTSWTRRALAEDEYPERKNPGFALDVAGGQAFVFGGVWSGYPKDGSPYTVRILGDLQRWDGTKWSEVATTGGPSPRAGHAMAWDAAHGQLVLFGGTDNAVDMGDTWTFDGQTWTQHTVSPSPSVRINTRMAYDPERQRVVLFSGQQVGPSNAPVNLDDTWEWDGAAWRDVSGAGPRPEGRGHQSMQYDPLRKRVMMFGGARHFSPLPPGSTLADQWEWNGTAWSKVEPQGAKPGPLSAASLSFDPKRNVMLLYGGFDGDSDQNGLWEWDGQRWVERSVLPVPRSDFGFAQSRPAGEAVLFGGYVTAGGVFLGDTHRNVDGRWSRVTGAAPAPRLLSALAYHGDDVVLVGGRNRTALFADMWILKKGESDWSKQSVQLPPPRYEAAMAHDAKRGVTVMFGGRGTGPVLGDTWEWDGAAWSQRMPPVSPPARLGGRMLWDPARQRLVLLGGRVEGDVLLDDAWAFDGTTWVQLGQTAAPTQREYATIAYDAFGRLISWGGLSGMSILGDLSIHDGSGWKVDNAEPPARFGAAWVDLGGRWQSVFGSQTDSRHWEDLTDVWELAPKPSE